MCRFLVRLLLVHGTLSVYRLARLIKYSFFKNIAFAFLLFFFQFYNGFSGQALVDGISAAAYNVAFTSLPILLFSVLDRPVRHFGTLIQYPQVRFLAQLESYITHMVQCNGQHHQPKQQLLKQALSHAASLVLLRCFVCLRAVRLSGLNPILLGRTLDISEFET